MLRKTVRFDLSPGRVSPCPILSPQRPLSSSTPRPPASPMVGSAGFEKLGLAHPVSTPKPMVEPGSIYGFRPGSWAGSTPIRSRREHPPTLDYGSRPTSQSGAGTAQYVQCAEVFAAMPGVSFTRKGSLHRLRDKVTRSFSHDGANNIQRHQSSAAHMAQPGPPQQNEGKLQLETQSAAPPAASAPLYGESQDYDPRQGEPDLAHQLSLHRQVKLDGEPKQHKPYSVNPALPQELYVQWKIKVDGESQDHNLRKSEPTLAHQLYIHRQVKLDGASKDGKTHRADPTLPHELHIQRQLQVGEFEGPKNGTRRVSAALDLHELYPGFMGVQASKHEMVPNLVLAVCVPALVMLSLHILRQLALGLRDAATNLVGWWMVPLSAVVSSCTDIAPTVTQAVVVKRERVVFTWNIVWRFLRGLVRHPNALFFF